MYRLILLVFCLVPVYLSAQNTNLSGFVSTEDGAFVNNVEVKLFDDQGKLVTSAFTVNGKYSFHNLPSGYDYSLQLDKSGHPLNGLSTFDFVLIAQHLLAVTPLTSGNQILAADLDGSQSISIADLVYLRQLILGVITELPQQRNWLFLSEDGVPAAGLNTFKFTLNGNHVLRNFVILKFGDMNKTAVYD